MLGAFTLALAGNLILGLMLPIANGPVGARMQSIVRPDMQGRVVSPVNSGATAIAPPGLLVAGPFSDWLGIRVWFRAGGILCVMIALAASCANKAQHPIRSWDIAYP